jgi:hypothetical protein
MTCGGGNRAQAVESAAACFEIEMLNDDCQRLVEPQVWVHCCNVRFRA